MHRVSKMKNMLKYVSPLIVVEEMAGARHFYEQLLGQKVKFDFGPNVTFQGDFAIHLRSHFQSLLGDASSIPLQRRLIGASCISRRRSWSRPTNG